MTSWRTANRRRARRRSDHRFFVRVMPRMGNTDIYATDMLQQLVSSLGLTYEQLAADYHRARSSSAEAYAVAESRRFWRDYYRREAHHTYAMYRYFEPFYTSVYAQLMWKRILVFLLGYDPQRLLADGRPIVHEVWAESQPIADQVMLKCRCGWRETISVYEVENATEEMGDTIHRKISEHVAGIGEEND